MNSNINVSILHEKIRKLQSIIELEKLNRKEALKKQFDLLKKMNEKKLKKKQPRRGDSVLISEKSQLVDTLSVSKHRLPRESVFIPKPPTVSGDSSKNLDKFPSAEFDLSISGSSNIMESRQNEDIGNKGVLDNFKKHQEIDLHHKYGEKEEELRESQMYSRRGRYEDYVNQSQTNLNIEF
mmetsp:Transcript_19027/g.16860  ORF Transcript_19027/g.16860 Transcript_19027/m.16860 type:complete len:181 (+) Transcript_19027:529-1071(+)